MCDDWSHHLGVRVVLLVVGNMFIFLGRALEIIFVSFNPRELVYALLDLDSVMTHGPMSKCTYYYVVL